MNTTTSTSTLAEEQTLLRQRIEACLASTHTDEIVTAIRRHDLIPDARPQGWIIDEAFVASPLDPRAVEAACRLWQALESTVRLVARRDAVRRHDLVGALHGRLREVVGCEADPFENPALRRDLTWALPKAEAYLATVADEVTVVEDMWTVVSSELAAGRWDVLNDGSFPQRKLEEVGAMSAEQRSEYLLSDKKRQTLIDAVGMFLAALASKSFPITIDPALAERWVGLTGRPVPRPRQFGAPARQAPRKGDKPASKVRAQERGRDEAARRATDPNRHRGYVQEGGGKHKKK